MNRFILYMIKYKLVYGTICKNTSKHAKSYSIRRLHKNVIILKVQLFFLQNKIYILIFLNYCFEFKIRFQRENQKSIRKTIRKVYEKHTTKKNNNKK